MQRHMISGMKFHRIFIVIEITEFLSIMDESNKLPQMFVGHDEILSIDLNIDGSLLVTGAEDGSVKVRLPKCVYCFWKL